MAEAKKEMSMDELKQLNAYLAKQVDEMSNTLRQNQFQELVVRLNFCFKVLELAKHFDKDYVEKCSKEIMRVLVMDNPEKPDEDAQTPEVEVTNSPA